MSRVGFWVAGCAIFLMACGDDSSTPDAGAEDSGARDDGGAECAAAEDCDDGLYCNGAEECRDGICRFGTPPACSDGIACTVDECDELADECVSAAPDVDGDGSRDASCTNAEGEPLGDDCDDADAMRFPGNLEICDANDHDEDCDPDTFGNRDVDGDGAFDAACCNGDVCGTDCDDTKRNVNPGVTEACDRLDNDCDGSVDEGVLISGLDDGDRDGYGAEGTDRMACAGTVGFVPHEAGDPVDCDDADPARNPGQVEICDDADNDCDPEIDEDPRPVTWYADSDGDGFGAAASGTVESCEPVDGHTLLGTDCDDTASGINPAAAEMCDGLDNDCNGSPDFEVDVNDFEDDDGDGIVDLSCGGPRGIDCDDADASSGPGTAEACDGRDNDCDESIDEGVMNQAWFADRDGDGYGSNAGGGAIGCSAPPGFVLNGGDCNDDDPAFNPGATEVCDTFDNDCNGTADEGGVCGCPDGLYDCNADGFCETNGLANRTCGGCPGEGVDCNAMPGVSAACIDERCVVIGCPAGFDDCDGDFTSGCETDLSDPSTCGSCGHVCSAIDGTPSCVGGACQIACDSGYGDCDGDPDNGCETSTDDDALHCGGCGMPCNPTGTTAVSCDSGSCVLDCQTERGDCDLDPSNGCEADLRLPDHCGTCDVTCGGPNTRSARCEDRGGLVCVLECVSGFADCLPDTPGCETALDDADCGCSGGPDCGGDRCVWDSIGGTAFCDGGGGGCLPPEVSCSSGCVDLSSDEMNCGGCNVECRLDGASATGCVGGDCMPTCDPGRGDCDADGSNGCESDTETDPGFCGDCFTDCFGTMGPDVRFPGCAAGLCTIEECRRDFGDCDLAVGNGCEADLLSGTPMGPDILDCGACGNDCVATDAHFAACISGRCELDCVSGYGDCDGDPSNGCETELSFDPGNCGACGTFCGVGGECSVGVCDGVVETASGQDFTCALRSSGTVVCWGRNDAEQLGVDSGVLTESVSPVVVGGGGLFARTITAGTRHACLIDDGGGVACWGDNSRDQLGEMASTATSELPELVPLPGPAAAIAAGAQHTCAVLEDGDVYCWGDNLGGQLGRGTAGGSIAAAAPVLSGGTPITAQPIVASGQFHTCVVQSFVGGTNQLWCWGADDSGQLGNGAGGPSNEAINVEVDPLLTGFIALSAGQSHTCAIGAITIGDEEGPVYCWGWNSAGQAGGTIGTDLQLANPIFGPEAGQGVALMTGQRGTCVLNRLGRLYCFGEAAYVPGSASTAVPSWWNLLGSATTSVQANGTMGSHACVVTTAGTVWCFGDNGFSQLGNPGAPASDADPQRVLDLVD